MNKRTGVLVGILAVLATVWVWFFALPGGAELQTVVVQRPGRPVMFRFDRSLMFDDIRLIKIEPGPPGQENETWDNVVWHLVADDDEEREPVDLITYGRWMRGMDPAEGTNRRGERLERGYMYRLEAKTADGDAITVPFTAEG